MTRTEKFFDVISKMPSTNLRIFVTLVLFVLTVVTYLIGKTVAIFIVGANPFELDAELVGLLIAFCFGDIAQYTSKRLSHKDSSDDTREVQIGTAYKSTKSEELATTDIPQEIDNPFEQPSRQGRGKR